jgi:FAD binding domain
MKVISDAKDIQQWFQDRRWALSANKIDNNNNKCRANKIYFPRTAQDVSQILQETPNVPVACIGGAHESSNVALCCGADNNEDHDDDALVLDFSHMDAIQVDDGRKTITVEPGVRFRALAEAVSKANGALPIGTGPDVGVFGFVLNGGLSGYFSKRLGLLGQRVVRLEIVTANGDIHQISPEQSQLFTCLLGAGSALAVVTSITFQMEDASIFQGGGQMVVVPCGGEMMTPTKTFCKDTLVFMRDVVMNDDSVAMELVVTSDLTCIATFIFYDSFSGDKESFVAPVREFAACSGLDIAVDNVTQWTHWMEAASCLWPILSEIKGDLLVTLQHCCGTKGLPSDKVLDFIVDKWLGESALQLAPMSIIEARTLGGAIHDKRELPTGNFHHSFFVDSIVMYDAESVPIEDRKQISDKTASLLQAGKNVESLTVDFSGTHSQPDDQGNSAIGRDIFGSEASFQNILAVKTRWDPQNRFRFHPFVSILSKNTE